MTPTKLSGWKTIARHLGRSERTIQLWETERGLPVRRIPGIKGWTVYAFTHEVDAWMSGTAGSVTLAESPPIALRATPDARPAGSADAEPFRHSSEHDARTRGGRKPGLLVLPLALRPLPIDAWSADVWTDDLIARFAALHPTLRVLSSTTSRQQRDRSTPIDRLSHELGVRYVVEGCIHTSGSSRRFDLRIIDAELDQVLVTNRFASSRLDEESFRNLVVDGVVEHLSLVLAGALVEPLYPNEIDPECHLHYLEGVRCFTDGTAEALERSRHALQRALLADAGFLPALALCALVDLQMSVDDARDAVDALSRAACVSDACRRNPAARVTAAFLGAAIALESDHDEAAAERKLLEALRAMPPSVALRGRLYERRSSRRSHETERPSGPLLTATNADEPQRRRSPNLFANVMRAMAGAHHRHRHAPLIEARRDADGATIGSASR